jgi:hypothetical protein
MSCCKKPPNDTKHSNFGERSLLYIQMRLKSGIPRCFCHHKPTESCSHMPTAWCLVHADITEDVIALMATVSVPLNRDGVCPALRLTTKLLLSIELSRDVAQRMQVIEARYMIELEGLVMVSELLGAVCHDSCH